MKNAITIRLDDELNNLLNTVAKNKRRKRSEVVRESLRRQLMLQMFDTLREQSLPYGERNNILTDEDVFKEIKDEKIQNNMVELRRNAELILKVLKKN